MPVEEPSTASKADIDQNRFLFARIQIFVSQVELRNYNNL